MVGRRLVSNPPSQTHRSFTVSQVWVAHELAQHPLSLGSVATPDAYCGLQNLLHEVTNRLALAADGVPRMCRGVVQLRVSPRQRLSPAPEPLHRLVHELRQLTVVEVVELRGGALGVWVAVERRGDALPARKDDAVVALVDRDLDHLLEEAVLPGLLEGD